MNIMEVVVSVWLLSVLGSASVLGWGQAVVSIRTMAAQRAADDCADNAAETYLAGGQATTEVLWNGLTCQVNITRPENGEQAVVTIVAHVGKASQTIWVPQDGF